MLILASASPRRQAMIKDAGYEFKVHPADIDETAKASESPEKLVKRLALEKAQKVLESYPNDIILAADTVVAWGPEILGKPADFIEARKMIEKLNGKKHSVFTGVAIIGNGVELNWIAETEVTFNQLTDQQVDDYLAQANPLDKAGAYAIQDHGELLVEEYDGLYSNVVGLPIEEVNEALKDLL